MDAMLQKHGAKHVYRIPEGLRELCADISREVLRAQPENIYCFIADYIDALLITRENAKVAVKVVNNIILGSESIVGILHQNCMSLEQIAIAATRIQKAFRSYLDLVDIQEAGNNEVEEAEERSRICIRDILESTGTTWEQAENAASTIQAAFRSHYEEMLAREAKGEVQWQRAVVNTMSILRRAGVSQEEAAKAVTLIQSSYRGYYARRNIKLRILSGAEEQRENSNVLEPRETIQAVAWMDMMFNDSTHTIERANEAATIIQSAFRGYRVRAQRNQKRVKQSGGSSQSMVVEAILDNLREMIWKKVKSVEKYPEEYGTREDMEKTADDIQTEYKNRQRQIKISEQFGEDDSEEEQLSGNAEQSKIEDARYSDTKIVPDVDAAQEFEVDAEIPQKESKEASHHAEEEESSPVELVAVEKEEKTDLKEHEEHEKHKEEEELAVVHSESEMINEHDEHDEH